MESILEIEENLGNKCWHKIENQILQCISSQGTPLYHRVIRIGTALQESSPDTAPTNHPNIRKEDNVTNIHVHKLTNTQPVMKRVTKSQLLFLSNSIRKSKDDLIQHYCLIFRRMENELEHDKGQHICYPAPK